ncbi:ammonium transporter [Methylothermus subterraneus]
MEQIVETRYALDTFYLLLSGVLVMSLGIGFALFQTGLMQVRNAAEVWTANLALYAVAYLAYLLVGYRLMYPEAPLNPLWPGIGWGIGQDHRAQEILQSQGVFYYSKMADFFFQAAFVVTVVAIVAGALAGRARLLPSLVFALVLTGFIYPLQGYWKWGGGFLDELGFLDFAGAGVVHLCGAGAALAGVLLLGPRAGKEGVENEVDPSRHNLPLAGLGALILWLGWFGFTGGAELKVSDIAEANAVARVFVNTQTAAAGGAVTALLAARAWSGKVDWRALLSGLLAGLVAIAAEPLTPLPWQSLGVGAVAGAIAVLFRMGLDKLGLDDPIGVLSIHGAAALWGLAAVCLTHPQARFGIQLLGAAAILGFAFAASLLVWWALKLTVGIGPEPTGERQNAFE